MRYMHCQTNKVKQYLQILRTMFGLRIALRPGPERTATSDKRGVFVVPTSELLGIGGTTQQKYSIEGSIDETYGETVLPQGWLPSDTTVLRCSYPLR